MRISGDSLVETELWLTDVAFSPDSSMVAYSCENAHKPTSVWLAWCAAGDPVLVNKFSGVDSNSNCLAFSAGGDRLLISLLDSYDDRTYSYPVDGGPGIWLGQSCAEYFLMPDGEHVLYLSGDRERLYYAPLDGMEQPLLLSTDMPSSGLTTQSSIY